MSDPTLGPLVPADESFNHQITDTFATVVAVGSLVDREGVRDGVRRDGSLQLGFGIGQVPEPRRDGRVRGHLARRRAMDGSRVSRELAPDPDVTRRRRSTTRSSSRCGVIRFAPRPNDVAADRASTGSSRPRCRRLSKTATPPEPADGCRARRRHRPLPPDRHRVGLGRGRRRRAPSSTTTRGSRPATTRGACATRWARRPPTSREPASPDGRRAR